MKRGFNGHLTAIICLILVLSISSAYGAVSGSCKLEKDGAITNFCGKKSETGDCFCDKECVDSGDCCPDYNETCANVGLCTDSDGGQEYYIKGTVSVNSNELMDYCSGTSIVEYYCIGDNYKRTSFACPNGCNDRACIKRKITKNDVLDYISKSNSSSTLANKDETYDYVKGECETDVTESVNCVMWDATSPQECYSGKGSCKGEVQTDSTGRTYVSCGVNVSGKEGEKVTWKSTCGGYAYTIIDGQNENAEFNCGTTPICGNNICEIGEADECPACRSANPPCGTPCTSGTCPKDCAVVGCDVSLCKKYVCCSSNSCPAGWPNQCDECTQDICVKGTGMIKIKRVNQSLKLISGTVAEVIGYGVEYSNEPSDGKTVFINLTPGTYTVRVTDLPDYDEFYGTCTVAVLGTTGCSVSSFSSQPKCDGKWCTASSIKVSSNMMTKVVFQYRDKGTAVIKIKRIDQNSNFISGTIAEVTGYGFDYSNDPSDGKTAFRNITPGTYTVRVTDLTGYNESYGTCTAPIGTACSISSYPSKPKCDGKWCTASSIKVSSNMKTNMVFQYQYSPPSSTNGTCPADAYICPDGSSVSRKGANCEFAHCPNYSSIDNTTAHWKFDEGSGDIAHDSSGSQYDGILLNGAAWVDGIIGSALSFDGINASVFVQANPAGMQILNNQDNVSLSLWIYPKALESDFSVLVKNSNLNITRFNLLIDNSSRLAFRAGYDQVNGIWSTISPISLNSWHHIAIRHRIGKANKNPIIYLDGILQTVFESQNPSGEPVTRDKGLSIGSNHAGGKVFNGIIDDVRVYNRLLNQSEILNLYKMGSPSCPADSKTCPDGSSVFRTGANCEFPACPV